MWHFPLQVKQSHTMHCPSNVTMHSCMYGIPPFAVVMLGVCLRQGRCLFLMHQFNMEFLHDSECVAHWDMETIKSDTLWINNAWVHGGHNEGAAEEGKQWWWAFCWSYTLYKLSKLQAIYTETFGNYLVLLKTIHLIILIWHHSSITDSHLYITMPP